MSRCQKGGDVHFNASPSHAEGAWCNECHGFAPLASFRESQWDEALTPYLADLRGIQVVLTSRETYRNALIYIAKLAGPGDSPARVVTCRALGVDPHQHLVWIDGAAA